VTNSDTWADAVARVANDPRTIRLDWVDFKHDPTAATRLLNLTTLVPPLSAALYATNDGKVGFVRKAYLSEYVACDVPLTAVTNFHVPFGDDAMLRLGHVTYASITAEFDGKRAFLMFTGVIPENFETTLLERVIGNVPTVPNLLPPVPFQVLSVAQQLIQLKGAWQQRGQLGRGRRAFKFWVALLRGQIDLQEYKLHISRRVKEVARELAIEVPPTLSLGHVANFLRIELE
jgi:hypothetical protein